MKCDQDLKEKFERAGKSIVLIGFMGAGKSAVAEQMHNILEASIVDTDSVIEEREGCTIAQIFAHPEKGEAYFRMLERNVIREFLEGEEPVILSTGGGAFMNNETRELILQKSNPVWLKISSEEAFQRIEADRIHKKLIRPVVHGADTIDSSKPTNSRVTQQKIIRDKLAERNPIYALAKLGVETEGINAEQVAGHALSSLYNYPDPA